MAWHELAVRSAVVYRRRGIEVVAAPCSGTRLRPVQLVEASGMRSAAQRGLAVDVAGAAGLACGLFYPGLGALKFI